MSFCALRGWRSPITKIKQTIPEMLAELRQLSEAKPDPAYAPLLNALREECECDFPELREVHQRFATKCRGTGYMARSWDGLPDGALEGALKNACMSLGWFVTWDTIDDQIVADVFDSESFTLAQVYASTSKEAVLMAVLEAIRKET
mgnify:CR=1 FL=1